METNGVIFIDSSDEENSPCKVRKCDIQTNEYRFNDIQISEIKSQAVEADVVLIEEEDLSKEMKCFPPSNGENIDNLIKKECDSKRIKLTTLDENTSECFKSSQAEKDKHLSESKNCNNVLNTIPSTSTVETEVCIELEDFLEACRSCNCVKKYKDMMMKKIPELKNKYCQADENFVKSEHFKKYINCMTVNVQEKPLNSIIIFNEVYKELESKKKQQINLSDREKCHVRKLHKALRKIHKRINQLENQEVNFDDDSNSSYIMAERYKERYCTIKRKICTLTNENFYTGRELFKNLNCKISTYPEVNRAINKLYNKNKQFPSYYEIDKCIRKCVKTHNLNLNENALNKEIRSVFTDVGQVLQRRRKSEFHDSLSYFLDGSCGDPADLDPEFETMLQTRHLENEKKINDVLQKYVERQETGEEQSLSSDSDDSHYASDESET